MIRDKITLVDSGSGAYNTAAYLIELNKAYKESIDIKLLGSHIGYKSIFEIKKCFYEFKRSIEPESKLFMACNTLNSVFKGYNGLFNELVNYIREHNNKRYLILSTEQTARALNNSRLRGIETMSLDYRFIQQIDRGIKPNIEIKTDLYDVLVLGCSHFDLINFETNLEILSTSKLGAYKLAELIGGC